ncbi:YceD family protein [Streptococcus respiraculi]|uniref:YceD family protein n=1 Tax=Streptococcus respiraculi TaxID=2021971 RepID=UPI000E724909|nr:YceD family protein [Streptococcus respiraculi]
MFHIQDIQKKSDGITFDETLELASELMARNADILAVSPIQVAGRVSFEAGFFLLNYQMTYDITLASSRSMEPVVLSESLPVHEIFVADEQALKDQDMVEEELVLIVENDVIVLAESVADNILLNIPLKVLTPEEVAGQDLPSGKDWTLMTEEDYAVVAQEKKEANSPFAQLQGLFEEE